ncbi:hypothetical protein HPB50_028648 [Hyalomma asiaticum]|nr:hypothetical protein HPB50_028648 [Hyalomma asiaticum]
MLILSYSLHVLDKLDMGQVHFSHTLPIACVSTCDHELMDTLAILKYPDRANSIRNRTMVNQEKWNRTSAAHRVEIQKLKLEFTEYKQVHFSHTLPIACVSSWERQLMDTVDILKSSDRANSIRNRVMVNQDKWNRTSTAHRLEIQALKLELMECKQGKRMGKDGTEKVNDMYHESSLLQTGDYLHKRNEDLEEMIEQLIAKYTELLAEQASVARFGRGDSDTADDVDHLIQRYLNEEEETEKSTDADEDTADHSGNESSDYEAQEVEKYVSMRSAAMPSFVVAVVAACSEAQAMAVEEISLERTSPRCSWKTKKHGNRSRSHAQLAPPIPLDSLPGHRLRRSPKVSRPVSVPVVCSAKCSLPAVNTAEGQVYFSHTLAIACVSTCDRELMDTLDILKYPDRANSIRNRTMVNQDKWNRTSAAHRVEIQKLKLEFTEYKQGKRMVNDGTEQVNDMFYESSLLQTGDCPRKTNEPLQEMIEQLIAKCTELVAEQAPVAWFGRGDSDTADDVDHVILRYQSEEEIEKSTDADEDKTDNSGNESSDYAAQELKKYVSMRSAAQLLRCHASGVFEGKLRLSRSIPHQAWRASGPSANPPGSSQTLPLLLLTN